MTLTLPTSPSPVPIGLPHTTVGEVEVGGYTVPADSIVLPHVKQMHHDPAVWPDPLAFKPQRFLGKDGQFCPPKENYLPFSIGELSGGVGVSSYWFC